MVRNSLTSLYGDLKIEIILNREMVSYTDPLQSLVKTDKDLLLKERDPIKESSVEITEFSEQIYKALVIQFNLYPSQYATMALREILKREK